jgi:hypothetical protein
MVKTGDEIIFFDAGVDKKGVVVGIEKGEDNRYELLIKDVLGNNRKLIEGDDTFQVIK